jgi:rod shape-determining protein MreB
MVIGQVTAEEIKMRIGCVFPRPEDITMTVKGRDAKTGLPRQIELFSSEIFEVLRRPARMITDEVLHVLEETSPELVGDIAQNGITLTGGGSQIWGMDQLIADRTAIACTIADDPDFCVVYGCGKAIGWINDTLNEGPINLARRRIMRE